MSIEFINQRIIDLNGSILSNKEPLYQNALLAKMLSVEFKRCLYLKPTDAPWADADEQEPIFGIEEFIEPLMPLYSENQTLFFQKIMDKYFPKEGINEDPCGQVFWQPKLFTPLTVGSHDYNDFAFNDKQIDTIKAFFQTQENIEFLLIASSYGYPDTYFISLSDQNIDNPTIYGTDITEYFSEIIEIGSFEDFLKQMFTPNELMQTIKTALDNKE